MSGIGVILNPHSRSNRRNPERIRRLAFIVGDKGSCHATQDVLDVPRIAEEFAQRQIEVIGISGGDGTIHHVISTLISVYGDRPLPMIALLRGGTINNVSNALKIQGTPESVLSRLILKYHENEPFETAALHCLNVNGRYGFLFGNGLVFNFIREYIERGEGGVRNVVGMLAKSIGSSLFHTRYMLQCARRFDAKVTVDGEEWPWKNYIVLDAGAVEPLGFGFRPFYRAREQPGHFHMMGLSMRPRDILSGLWNIWRAKATGSEHYLESLAQEVVIELAEPQGYTIDGEIYPPVESITLRCGPQLCMIRA